MISVRNLVSEKPELWYEINSEEKGFSHKEIKEKACSLKEKFIKSIENPEDFFIVFKDNIPAGKIYRYRDRELQDGSSAENGIWLLQSFSVKAVEKDRKTELFKGLVDHVKDLSRWKELKIMLSGPTEDKLKDFLTESGFHLEIRKQYFRKDLKELKAHEKEDSILKYKNLSQTGDSSFIELFGNIQKETINSDAQEDAKDPGKAFNCFKDPARFNPDLWLIAYYDNMPAGMVLPGVEKGTEPLQGFIQFIGVLPHYRNRGWGKILLQKGIRELCKNGAELYIGSTDVSNIPMIKLFNSLECKKSALYDIWNIRNL